MFSLIITILSIALVVALSLATVYYGGAAMTSSVAEAKAVKILNQGQQLLGAAELYYTEKKEYPVSIQAMVAEGFLKSTPIAQAPIGEAYAEAPKWEMPTPKVPLFVLKTESSEACKLVNKYSSKLDRVFDSINPAFVSQCYKTNPTQTVVLSRNVRYVADYAASNPTGGGGGTPPTGGGLVVTGGTLDFGTSSGSAGASRIKMFRVTNTGPTLVSGMALKFESSGGDVSPPFSPSYGTCYAYLAPGAYCDYAIKFAPRTNQALDPGVYSDNMTLNGVVIGSVRVTVDPLVVDPSKLDFMTYAPVFGILDQNSVSTPQVVQVSNYTGTPVPYAPSVTGPFSILSTTCGATIGSGSCTVSFSANTSAIGKFEGKFTLGGSTLDLFSEVVANEGAFPPYMIWDYVYGYPEPRLHNVVVGETLSTELYFKNVGRQSAVVYAELGAHPGLSIGSTNCGTPSNQRTIKQHEFCTVTVNYTPVGVDDFSGIPLTIKGSFGGAPVAMLQGSSRELAPANGVFSDNADFGAVIIGEVGAKYLQFINMGEAPATGVFAELNADPSVTVFENYCGTASSPIRLNSGQRCNIVLYFEPTSEVNLSGSSLTVKGNFPESPAVAPITGAGVP